MPCKLSVFCELIALVLIGVDHYIHVVHALRYADMSTMQWVRIAIVTQWMCSILLSGLQAAKLNIHTNSRTNEFYENALIPFYAILWLSTVGLFILYLCIFGKSKVKNQNTVHPINTSIKNTKKYRAFKMVYIVFGAIH